KSTLLHLLGCVDTPSSGSVWFEGRDVSALSDSERGRIRLMRIGFVFQRFFLLPMLTAWENVELPQAESGVSSAERRPRARTLLAMRSGWLEPRSSAELSAPRMAALKGPPHT